MEIIDVIYKLSKELPPDKAEMVLSFVEFLLQSSPQSRVSDGDLSQYLGVLESSPSFNKDPVTIQKEIRNEWD